MNKLDYKFGVSVLATPIISFVIWLCTGHTWVNFINVFFIVSIVLGIILFIALMIQEGIFDVTSFGFRKFRYQMMRKKTKSFYEDDEFFNPKTAKKSHYYVDSWLKFALYIQVVFILISICLAFIIK
ncbi:DUF3899 domain-containing protein [Staphylococcus canis]|uniref:DUF3899 domain-containing protein n=1 Tax=Staphylococcus canis TaxID=2724942 RepID=A0ABS0T967_9STAP|nr:DUF3899 domain-containing protein [Staphylococcus canis]